MSVDLSKVPKLLHFKNLALKMKSEQTTILTTCTAALTEMNGVKQDKPVTGTVTIGTTAGSVGSSNVWINDNAANFPYYYDIPVTGITEDYICDVTIANSSHVVAMTCGISPVSETMDGFVRIRSYSIPESSITAYLRIINAELPESSS